MAYAMTDVEKTKVQEILNKIPKCDTVGAYHDWIEVNFSVEDARLLCLFFQCSIGTLAHSLRHFWIVEKEIKSV